MKKIIFIILILIFIVGCSEQMKESNEEQQLANPASVYCEEQGGTLRMEENEAGQYGVCTLPDGTECEEWAYYRGECPEEEVEIFCPDYDGNQDECLTHSECKWTSEENMCEPIDIVEEDEEVKDDEGDVDEEKGFASKLEEGLPDTVQNEICKKLPLTNELSPGDRHYCFAIVNNNPKFCEFIVIDNEGDIEAKNEKNLCLAHANKDSSYCKKMSDNEAKHDCYYGLSMISGDINFCDGINYDKNDRELCYWSFANALH